MPAEGDWRRRLDGEPPTTRTRWREAIVGVDGCHLGGPIRATRPQKAPPPCLVRDGDIAGRGPVSRSGGGGRLFSAGPAASDYRCRGRAPTRQPSRSTNPSPAGSSGAKGASPSAMMMARMRPLAVPAAGPLTIQGEALPDAGAGTCGSADGVMWVYLISAESDPRARSNNPVRPRLPRPTGTRARNTTEGRRRRATPAVFILRGGPPRATR